MHNCLFCNLDTKNILVENELAFAIYDAYPVTQYHTLIIPKRHVESYFDLDSLEIGAMHQLLKIQRELILKIDTSVTGFNIGINVSRDAGQTIFHVHMHLIPRRENDVSDARGGVRGVIPSKQKY